MMPEQIDLDDDAEQRLEAIDARLDEIDDESTELLNERSRLIDSASADD